MPILNKDITGTSVIAPPVGVTTFFTDSGAAYLKSPTGTITPLAGTVGGSFGDIQYNNGSSAAAGTDDLTFDSNYSGQSILWAGGWNPNHSFLSQDGAVVAGSGGGLSSLALYATTGGVGLSYGYQNSESPGSPILTFDGINLILRPTNGGATSIEGDGGIYIGSVTGGAIYLTNNSYNQKLYIQSTNVVGTATLSGGTVTVSVSGNSPNSLYFITVQTLGTVTSPKPMTATYAATNQFTITSADPTDTSTVAWLIIN